MRLASKPDAAAARRAPAAAAAATTTTTTAAAAAAAAAASTTGAAVQSGAAASSSVELIPATLATSDAVAATAGELFRAAIDVASKAMFGTAYAANEDSTPGARRQRDVRQLLVDAGLEATASSLYAEQRVHGNDVDAITRRLLTAASDDDDAAVAALVRAAGVDTSASVAALQEPDVLRSTRVNVAKSMSFGAGIAHAVEACVFTRVRASIASAIGRTLASCAKSTLFKRLVALTILSHLGPKLKASEARKRAVAQATGDAAGDDDGDRGGGGGDGGGGDGGGDGAAAKTYGDAACEDAARAARGLVGYDGLLALLEADALYRNGSQACATAQAIDVHRDSLRPLLDTTAASLRSLFDCATGLMDTIRAARSPTSSWNRPTFVLASCAARRAHARAPLTYDHPAAGP